MIKPRKKFIRSFYNHPELGKLLPLADNDPMLYDMGPVLIVNHHNRTEFMLFEDKKDWDNFYVYTGIISYTNTHKDLKAPYVRDDYKISYYRWVPQQSRI